MCVINSNFLQLFDQHIRISIQICPESIDIFLNLYHLYRVSTVLPSWHYAEACSESEFRRLV